MILKEFFENLIITSNGGGIAGSGKISLTYQFLDFDFFFLAGGGGANSKKCCLSVFFLFSLIPVICHFKRHQ